RNDRGLALTKTEDADGLSPRVTSYTWHADLRLPLSRTTSEMQETFTYDVDGLLTGYSQTDVLVGSPSNGEVRTWTYAYTPLASGLKVLTSLDGPGLLSDGVNDVTSYTYNADGTLASMTDPNGLVTTYATYDGFGNPTRIVEPDGIAWSMTYDAEGQLLEVIENVDQSTARKSTFTYDIIGQLTSYTNGRNKAWTFTYDEARRLVETQTPDGDTVDLSYNLAGLVTKTEYRDSSGTVTFFADADYDELGRLKELLGAEGQTTAFTYDEEDNLSTAVDALNLVTSNSYDPLNRVTQVVDRAAGTTLMEHNESNQMTEYTDPRGLDTGFAYNGFGDLLQETSTDRGVMSYTYDRRGLATSATDARGIVTNYAYDNGGRLTAKTFPSAPSEDQSFTFGTGGNLSEGEGKPHKIFDEAGRMEYTYDDGGYLSRDRRIINGKAYDTKYKIDSFARLQNLTTPGRLQIKHGYDDQDRVRRIEIQRRVRDPITNQYPAKVIVARSIQYEPSGPLKSFIYADGTAHTREYDDSYRLTRMLDDLSGSILRDTSYSWTGRDNLAVVSDALNGLNTETYQFSAREFLSQATGPYDQLDFTYDAVGNRASRAITASATTVTDLYTYPLTSNKLESITQGAGGTRTLLYDAAGNVTYDNRNGGGYGYTYNAAGRMESFSINGVVQSEYVYNAMGQQVIRRLTQAGQTIHSIHDSEGNRLA
ncbi:hypothetical protein ABMC88_18440, partial [Sulfitobacter sp. HNIBRBA2951]|uniref:hypothetical protein n=1 Tax=Sulfitobacter aquimarinus TaxID=3158557 RepID=UPI0032DF752C